MKYGDLSSIVQLGVGLHVGTAILQLYSDLGLAPMERRLERIRELFDLPEEDRPSPELKEELDRIEGRYRLFKIEFFKQYRWLVLVNSIIAAMLVVLLIIIAYKSDDPIGPGYDWFPIAAIALAILPAPIILGSLWLDAWRRLKPIKQSADNIERRALTP